VRTNAGAPSVFKNDTTTCRGRVDDGQKLGTCFEGTTACAQAALSILLQFSSKEPSAKQIYEISVFYMFPDRVDDNVYDHPNFKSSFNFSYAIVRVQHMRKITYEIPVMSDSSTFYYMSKINTTPKRRYLILEILPSGEAI
jgi:hypothetical protein